MTHKHKFERIGSIGYDRILLRCKCDERKERPATASESRRLRQDRKDGEAQLRRMNRIAWEFDRTFKTYQKLPDVTIGGKVYKNNREANGWKWLGYELMSRVRKWAKKYPEDVFICGIDDTYFSSSDIVFILHRPSPRKNWGTDVIVLTQCDGLPPKEFFMYPGHAAGIREALGKIGKLKSLYS